MRRLVALLLLCSTTPALAAGKPRSYRSVVMDVAGMMNDDRARELVAARGLDLLNVMWEDTGRWLGSAVGPNISDVTIEVQMEDQKGHLSTALMPVIRYPNFTDVTGDVKMDSIQIPVGNQKKDGTMEVVTLTELLRDPLRYLSAPGVGKIKGESLLAKRDSHVLVSAQAAFLPVPRESGKAVFWPVIFNYQSTKAEPAVLTILVTRQGTSVTVVDNARDSLGGSWGQRLFFNSAGMRTPLTAERLSSVQEKGVTMNGESAASLGDDANLLMLIQVPLKIRPQPRPQLAPMMDLGSDSVGGGGYAQPSKSAPATVGRDRSSDVETAVLGHGPELGPFVELAGKTIARDPRFPVRVTVQFYQATSNGVLSAKDVTAMKAQIRKVYRQADYVGSLVVPTKKDKERPTLWDGVGSAPAFVSWHSFAGLVERFRATTPGG